MTTKIKNAILSGEVVEKNAWSIHVDTDDQVVIFPPKGAGFKTSLANIDRAVKDFCKKAEMPIPGVKTSHPPKDVSDPDLGKDTTTDSPFTVPKVNTQDDVQGQFSSPTLGPDSSTKKPFNDPSVIKRQPVEELTGGLPDTELGEDSSSDEPNFHDHKVTIQEDGRVSGRRRRVAGDPDPEEMYAQLINDEGSYLAAYDILRDNDVDANNIKNITADFRDAFGSGESIGFWEDVAREFLNAAWAEGFGGKTELSQEKFDALLVDILDEAGVPAMLSTPGIYELLLEHYNNEIYDAQQEDENVDEVSVLEDLIIDAADLLQVPGAYEILSEVYNNDVIEMFEDDEDNRNWEPQTRKGARGASRTFRIQDTFSQEKTPDIYSKLAKKGPSASLLENIMDPEMWAANNLGAIAQAYHGGDLDRDMSDPHRQNNDTPALVGYDPEARDSFSSDDVDAGCHGPAKKKKSLRRRGEGFNPSKKTETKPEVSDVDLTDSAEDSDRKAELDEATDYAFREAKTARRRASNWRRFAQGWNLEISPEEAAVEQLMTMGYDAAMASNLVSAYSSGQQLDPESAKAVEQAMQSAQMSVAANRRKAGPKLREKWDDTGGYNRDMEAESAEELYHLVRSFGSEDPYDWSSYKPQMPVAPEGTEQGNAAGEKFEGDDGLGGAQANKKVRKLRAVDDKAKKYWKDYFKEYGAELVDAEPKKRGPKSEKKESRRQAIRNRVKVNISKRAQQRLAQEAMNPATIPGGQNALAGAPLADAGPPAPAQGGAPPPKTPKAPTAPAAPKGGEIPPGAGDSGLQALGWTTEEIQVMTPEEKQKILQIKLNKPGTKPKAPAQAPGGAGAPKPAPKIPAPGAPPAGGAPAPAPAPAPVPPVEARILARRLESKFKIRRAQQALEAPPAAPAQAPTPQAAPAAPDAGISDMGSTEEKAFQILQEVRQQEVGATDSAGIAIAKNKMLAQRLMTEAGMTLDEAKKLFGIQNTLKLFQ